MNNNWQKILLTFALPIILIGAVAFYIYTDLHRPAINSLSNSETTQNIPIVASTGTSTGGYTVTMLDPKNGKPSQANVKKPDLSASVVNSSHIDDAAFKVIAQNITTLTNDLKKDSTDESKWLNLGIFRKMIGDYPAALEIFTYVSMAWPTDYIPFNNMADLYQFYLKNYSLAEKNWLQVIALKPDYPDAYENLYVVYRDFYKEKQSLALPTLLKGLENNPKSIDLMVYVARHYRSTGDTEKAKIYYNKAIAQARLVKGSQLETMLSTEAGEI
ncbi:MAG: tetratricopeptide repeat protein [Patescibacteria group bacterium]